MANTIKKLINADPGDADRAGGDDWDQVATIINDGWNDRSLKLNSTSGGFVGSIINPTMTASGDIQLAQNSEAVIVVYVDAETGHYAAKNIRRNTITSDGTVFETVMQAAITAAGDDGTVILRDGSYTLSGAFTGFTVRYQQTIKMAHGARIIVPNGYTGSVFILDDNVPNSMNIFQGGLIYEAGTPARLWTCFDMFTDSNTACFRNVFQHMRILYANKAFALRTDGVGWSNANTFHDIFIDSCVIGIDFVHTGTFTDGQSGCNANLFTNITVQGTASATDGIKNINGRRNVFINCYTADFAGAQVTSSISANASNTHIYGGTMTYLNFTDSSPTLSFINDEFVGHKVPRLLVGRVVAPSQGRSGTFNGISASAGCDGIFQGALSAITVGGGTTVGVQQDSGGISFRWSSSATINSLSGEKCAGLYTRRDYNPITETKLLLGGGTTSLRCFFGLFSTTTSPVSAADPMNAMSGVAFGVDTSVDGNWHIYQNSGSGASDSTTIANVATMDNNAHTFALRAVESLTKWQYAYDFTNIGRANWVNINTKIPAATTALGWMWWIEDLAASTRTLQVYYIQHYQDK